MYEQSVRARVLAEVVTRPDGSYLHLEAHGDEASVMVCFSGLLRRIAEVGRVPMLLLLLRILLTPPPRSKGE